MKKLTHITVLLLFLLPPVFCRAESEKVEQDFIELNKKSAITFSSGNKVAETDLLTYTCNGKNAEFGSDGKHYVIQLVNSGEYVTTTRVDELKRIFIYCNQSETPSNIQIYLSKDGVDYGSPLSAGVEYLGTGTIDAGFPRGNYYVKIVNTKSSNSLFIYKIDYYLDHCNCFEYVP